MPQKILKHKCLELFFSEVSEFLEFRLYQPPNGPIWQLYVQPLDTEWRSTNKLMEKSPKWKTTCPSQRITNISIFCLLIKTDYPVFTDRLWTRPFTQKLNMTRHTCPTFLKKWLPRGCFLEKLRYHLCSRALSLSGSCKGKIWETTPLETHLGT